MNTASNPATPRDVISLFVTGTANEPVSVSFADGELHHHAACTVKDMKTFYDKIGEGYARARRPDPRIADQVIEVLGDAESVANIVAGAGSYEPRDRLVVAAEPSTTMIRQRPPGSAHVVQARAEALPFPSGSFDTVLAILTIHHWDSPILGLLEMRRVSRKRVVVLTWDQDVWESFWLIREYIPCIRDLDRRRAVDFSTIKRIYWGLVLSVPSRFLMTVATAFMGPFGDDQRLILMRKSGQEYRHVRFYLATSTSPDSIDWRRMLGAGSGKKSTMTCSPGYRLIVAEMS